MKALRWHGKEDVRVDEVPTPEPGPGQVLIKVTYSGICGSEVHEYAMGPIFIPMEPHPVTKSSAPQILGHEFGGRIAALGEGVTGLKEGDVVMVNPILSCGQCAACRRGRPSLCDVLAYYGLIGDGGHAEYAVVRKENCVLMPEGVPEEYVAFGEPAGVAYHAANKAKIREGDSVLVLGAGPIGQLAAQYARVFGAEKVFMTEIAPARIAYAEALGSIDAILNPVHVDVVEEILALTEGNGVDVAIECSGGSKTGMLEDTAAQAVEVTRAEGTTIIVGTFASPTSLHFNNLVLMEKTIMGSWTWATADEYKEGMDHVISGAVKVMPLISRRVPIERAVDDGIRELLLNRDEHVKILVDLT